MAPRKHYVWEHFDLVEASDKTSGHDKAKCKHCKVTFTLGTTRAKAHHAGIAGAGIVTCPCSPPELQERLVSEITVATERQKQVQRLKALTSSEHNGSGKSLPLS
jgi:hypothetical protein